MILRRLLFELGKARVSPLPSRSTIYRVLVRHGLVAARKRKRRRQDYKRWERDQPMQLWQMDVTASVFLADGTECKLISGIDDHSRFCVIATVVRRATARAICRAFLAAMSVYGIPDEVLTDNGKQFTGRFGKPRPAEVLFERICRKNGIRQLLTRPYSPTTIGKVERWHQTPARRAAQRRLPVRDHRGGSGRGGCLAAGIQPGPAAPVAGHGHPGQPVPALAARGG